MPPLQRPTCVRPTGSRGSSGSTPVSGADRCPICTFGHDVRDCDLMESLSAKQVKAGERKGQYLKKLPAAAS
ncbi:hypothetical protein Tdes44962_MAKER09727 [Teratosphaeria destructans]|uniref:Uncharacterized protein n=1 Tax=Teratosphaeria destructans TaxID=418781 RepID=A0A9W7SRQ5_9PEZI|nr:hypothetical protein Tdes44962_MAKER09727 [Teratosphaeria destructans]